ncbi:LAMI_0D09670g1_1 [Lachancea mirantina]|uniref:LAMI_0D09670g1_1 n=1 Tax=Lachancea mirantina TaxID=1230905 RepID=A0A1G4JDT6_9SACH|nr:LAMI_0D09670g1_1 [Lachancea mirantina]
MTEKTSFKVANSEIATRAIEPLSRTSRCAWEDGSVDGSVDDGVDDDVEFTFPSHPKRFHHGLQRESLAPSIADGSGLAADLAATDDDVGSLLARNDDFWREVGSSCGEEDAEPAPVPVLTPAPAPASAPVLAPVAEPRLDDFIRDADLDSLASTCALESALESVSPHYRVRNVCLRDADGKLALTGSQTHGVHKPAQSAAKRSRKLLRRVLRRNSGVWEMVCPSVAVAEFMLL